MLSIAITTTLANAIKTVSSAPVSLKIVGTVLSLAALYAAIPKRRVKGGLALPPRP
ncbi:hypothetical protein HDU67_002281, partial [Dinochytrium kinnereticum]